MDSFISGLSALPQPRKFVLPPLLALSAGWEWKNSSLLLNFSSSNFLQVNSIIDIRSS